MASKYKYTRYYSETEAECTKCGEIKEHSAFNKNRQAIWRGGLDYYCKECANRRGREKHKTYKEDENFRRSKRNTYLKHRHGLTVDQYEEKLKAQGNCCALCGVELPMGGYFTHLDHCHMTGKLRDFLCTNCNRGLGHFQDNPEVLRKAADYIESHRSSVDASKEVIVDESSH